jgi:hypothetical protein
MVLFRYIHKKIILKSFVDILYLYIWVKINGEDFIISNFKFQKKPKKKHYSFSKIVHVA